LGKSKNQLPSGHAGRSENGRFQICILIQFSQFSEFKIQMPAQIFAGIFSFKTRLDYIRIDYSFLSLQESQPIETKSLFSSKNQFKSKRIHSIQKIKSPFDDL
jgi:hypothetical protein